MFYFLEDIGPSWKMNVLDRAVELTKGGFNCTSPVCPYGYLLLIIVSISISRRFFTPRTNVPIEYCSRGTDRPRQTNRVRYSPLSLVHSGITLTLHGFFHASVDTYQPCRCTRYPSETRLLCLYDRSGETCHARTWEGMGGPSED